MVRRVISSCGYSCYRSDMVNPKSFVRIVLWTLSGNLLLYPLMFDEVISRLKQIELSEKFELAVFELTVSDLYGIKQGKTCLKHMSGATLLEFKTPCCSPWPSSPCMFISTCAQTCNNQIMWFHPTLRCIVTEWWWAVSSNPYWSHSKVSVTTCCVK